MANCGTWSAGFDPFGLFPKLQADDDDVPSDEENADNSLEVHRAVLDELLAEPEEEKATANQQRQYDSSSPSRSVGSPQKSGRPSNQGTTPRSDQPATLPALRRSPQKQNSRVARQIAQVKNDVSSSSPRKNPPLVLVSGQYSPSNKPSVASRMAQQKQQASPRASTEESIEVSPSADKGVLVVSTKNESSKLNHTPSYDLTTFTGSTGETDDFSSLDASTDSDNMKQYVYPERTRRRWSTIIILVATVLLLLILALASLGAAGKFSKKEEQVVPASKVDENGDVPWDLDVTVGTVGTNDGHDTDEPPEDGAATDEDAPPPQDGVDEDSPPPDDAPDEDSPPPADAPYENSPPPTYEVDETPPPTSSPTGDPNRPTATYEPGLLIVKENGLLLSKGLKSRQIAERRRLVEYSDGTFSVDEFHVRPDYGACFAVPPNSTYDKDGWVYVSNSELGANDAPFMSGVGAIYFDKHGNVTEYKMLLVNSTKNCAGGRTPWDTFISCEEARDIGGVWQIDPFDQRPPEQITMGQVGGRYEAFAYDDRDKNMPRFFVTEDLSNGPTIRWTPDYADWNDPWNILTGPGTLEYLVLDPYDVNDPHSGTFSWTKNLTLARENAQLYARGTEGIDCKDNLLYFVCKTDRLFYILDLDAMTFVMYDANIGLFDGEPDQVKRMINDTQDILYFSEQSDGHGSGIHGRNSDGRYFTILEGPAWKDEATTGLSFSPNGLHMYMAFQDPGVVFDIWREDGLPFHGEFLDVHYHNPPLDHLLLRH